MDCTHECELRFASFARGTFAGAVMGQQFAASVSLLLPTLAFARFFGAITNQYVHVSFQLAERPVLQVVNAAFMLCLYLAFMVLFVRLWGLPGAAAAALASELCGLAFGLWLTQKGFRFDLASARRMLDKAHHRYLKG